MGYVLKIEKGTTNSFILYLADVLYTCLPNKPLQPQIFYTTDLSQAKIFETVEELQILSKNNKLDLNLHNIVKIKEDK